MNDISGNITVVDITPCPSGGNCTLCDIIFAQAGLCAPGKYIFLYNSQDAEGQVSEALRVVRVAASWSLNMVRHAIKGVLR
jgi:hypothetical protein